MVVGRLLMVLHEEEAFHLFCQLIEVYMPKENYQMMFGARVDTLVVQHLLRERLPKVISYLEDELMYDVSLNVTQWFSCLFCYNFNFEVLFRLWDVYFIKGEKTLFRFALAIFYLQQN